MRGFGQAVLDSKSPAYTVKTVPTWKLLVGWQGKLYPIVSQNSRYLVR